MVLYIGIYIESDWLYHAEWVALSNGQSGSDLVEYSIGLPQFYMLATLQIRISQEGIPHLLTAIQKYFLQKQPDTLFL